MTSCLKSWNGSSRTTSTCVISSSPSNAAGCGRCKPEWGNGPRQPPSIANQFLDEGLIGLDEALRRVSGDQLAQLMFPRFGPDPERRPLTVGRNASPGAATGAVVFDSPTAVARARAGQRVILVRREASPDDLDGMIAATGVLTGRGGRTSHVTIRLLDPPLHEFLPDLTELSVRVTLARERGTPDPVDVRSSMRSVAAASRTRCSGCVASGSGC